MSTVSVFGLLSKENVIDSSRLSQPSLNKGNDKNFQDMLALLRTLSYIGSKKHQKFIKELKGCNVAAQQEEDFLQTGTFYNFLCSVSPSRCSEVTVSMVSLRLPSHAAKILHNQCLASRRGHLLWISKGEKSTEGIRVGSSPTCASCTLLKQTIERLENQRGQLQKEKGRYNDGPTFTRGVSCEVVENNTVC